MIMLYVSILANREILLLASKKQAATLETSYEESHMADNCRWSLEPKRASRQEPLRSRGLQSLSHTT